MSTSSLQDTTQHPLADVFAAMDVADGLPPMAYPMPTDPRERERLEQVRAALLARRATP